MVVLYVFLILIVICVALFASFVCARICVEIVRNKNSKMSEVMWFWFGFFFTFIAVLCTLCVKDESK